MIRKFLSHVFIALAIVGLEIPTVSADVSTTKPAPAPFEEAGFGDLRFHRGPHIKQGPGQLILIYGGYAGNDAHHRRVNYQSSSERLGEVNVEIGFHAADYPYLIHDFLSLFRGNNFSSVREANMGQFVERPMQTGKRYAVYYLKSNNPPGESGLIGWYQKDTKTPVTVVISYEHLREIPWNVVDAYLLQYPSDVVANDVRFVKWEENDLEKWSTLLKTRGTEDKILRMAAISLRKYDTSAFGLQGKKGNSPDLSQVLQGAIGKINERREQLRK